MTRACTVVLKVIESPVLAVPLYASSTEVIQTASHSHAHHMHRVLVLCMSVHPATVCCRLVAYKPLDYTQLLLGAMDQVARCLLVSRLCKPQQVRRLIQLQ